MRFGDLMAGKAAHEWFLKCVKFNDTLFYTAFPQSKQAAENPSKTAFS
jgi:hypothetical protein